MSAMWDLPDFDDHEAVHFFHDIETGLSAIIALHSTHLGPGAVLGTAGRAHGHAGCCRLHDVARSVGGYIF